MAEVKDKGLRSQHRQQLFIYDRREMGVLVFLTVLIGTFAFTLGVHMGKSVAPKDANVAAADSTAPAETIPDKVPNKEEVAEQNKDAPPPSPEVQDYLNQTLKEEIARTGIKLDSGRQTELPKQTKAEAQKTAKLSSKGHEKTHEGKPSEKPAESSQAKPHGEASDHVTGATHGETASETHGKPPSHSPEGADGHSGGTHKATGLAGHGEPAHAADASKVAPASEAKVVSVEAVPAARRAAPEGTFTLQIGSHQTVEEALEQVQALEAYGMLPFLRTVELKGKGRWFRIFLGGYESRDRANQTGQRLVAERKIKSYLVAKLEN